MPLRATIELAIDLAASVAALATWWREHQHALRLLDPADLSQVIALKDHRKRRLEAHQHAAASAPQQPRLV